MLIFSSFNMTNLISFFLGLLSGMILLLAIILIFISTGKKNTKKIRISSMKMLDEEKVKNLIVSKQSTFIKEVEENDKEMFKTMGSLVMELLHEISSYYYPNSLYPEFELSILEAADLIKYIVDQVVLVFNKPVLNNFKNVKISFITSTIDKTNKVKNSAIVKGSESGKEAYNAYKTAVNTLNPVFLFRKVFINGTINIALKKFCKSTIAIAGREMNKVYSKDLFKEKEDISDAVNKDIEEIFSDEE